MSLLALRNGDVPDEFYQEAREATAALLRFAENKRYFADQDQTTRAFVFMCDFFAACEKKVVQ